MLRFELLTAGSIKNVAETEGPQVPEYLCFFSVRAVKNYIFNVFGFGMGHDVRQDLIARKHEVLHFELSEHPRQ